MESSLKRIGRRLRRDCRPNLLWMAFPLLVACSIGIVSLYMLEGRGVQHPYRLSSMFGFVGCTLMLVMQAWREEAKGNE